MLLVAKIGVLLLSLVVFIRALRFWFRHQSVRTADLSSGMLIMFYVLPILYDTAGFGDYVGLSTWSDWVQTRYCLLVMGAMIIIQAVAWLVPKRYVSFHAISRQHQMPLEPQGNLRALYQLSWLGMLVPVVAVIVLANPFDYLTYGNLYNRGLSNNQSARFASSFITYATLIAVLCFFVTFWVSLCRTRRVFSVPTVAALILGTVPAYIHGKRSIIFLMLVMAVAASSLEARLRIRYVAIVAVGLIVFSFIYVGNWKGLDKTATEFVAGDLSRDYTLGFAVQEAELTTSRIVPYRNAGYEFSFVFFVPRIWYPDKPWPTSVYFTNRFFDVDDDKYMGWGLGVGFQEEALANMGYVGWGLACISMGLLCGWVDRQIYCKSTYFVLLWAPLLYGHVFAFNVIFKILVCVIIPALLIQKLFTSPASWESRRTPPHKHNA